MKKIITSILLSVLVVYVQAQVQYAGSTVTTEVINDNLLTTSINVPSSAFTGNLIAVAVTEYKHSYPVTITDVYSQKAFKLGQSTITNNGSIVAIYYLADAAVGSHSIRVSTGRGNNTNIQTVTTAYTGVDIKAPIAVRGSKMNTESGNRPTLEINCSTDQLVVDAMIFEEAINPVAGPLPAANQSYINRNIYNLETSAKTNSSGKLNLTWDYTSKAFGYWGLVALTLQPTRYAILAGQLINFSGKPANDRVELSWVTTFENNLKYIAVMRSVDNNDWKEVIRLTTSGNSPVQKAYDVMDKNIGSGNYFYRLVFVSGDGKKATSPIIRIKSAAEKKLRFGNMQNPFVNDLQLSVFTSSDNNVLVTILNSRGITVATRSVKPVSGEVEIKLPLSVTPGIYFVQCSSDKEMITKTMVKN